MGKKPETSKFLITKDVIKFSAYKLTYTVPNSHVNFNKIKEMLQAEQTRKAVGLYNDGLKKEVKKGIVFKGNDFYYKGQILPEIFAKAYRSCLENKVAFSSVTKFFDNVLANPALSSVKDFARFLEHCQMPITNRGTFLAYKRVRADFKDCHSGRIDNSVGRKVSIERKAVDNNCNNTCSYGLHVCAYSYLGHFSGDRVVVVEVNPKDVVAVPVDYDGAKIRVCEYRVLDELKNFTKRIKNFNQDPLGSLKYYDLSKHA